MVRWPLLTLLTFPPSSPSVPGPGEGQRLSPARADLILREPGSFRGGGWSWQDPMPGCALPRGRQRWSPPWAVMPTLPGSPPPHPPPGGQAAEGPWRGIKWCRRKGAGIQGHLVVPAGTAGGRSLGGQGYPGAPSQPSPGRTMVEAALQHMPSPSENRGRRLGNVPQ